MSAWQGRMICSNCGSEYPAGRKFCSWCGKPIALTCPSCGAGITAEDRFCGDCGAALGAVSAPNSSGGPAASPTPELRASEAERRLVTVLFADLVGFMTLSERRDAEDVRELLTRYFDTASRLVGRHGGVVEKFIGDAVMAVWGSPTALEDDAERAVRTALDLVEAVAALGVEVGAPDLRARAAVLTGEAAVTLGAKGQGMVAGDLVNTAARVQSAAEPGTVLVGGATRRASEAAVIYEDAGVHELRGRAEPVRLWRAVRVVAGVGGVLKSSALEAPFVGRKREMRLVKELFHATAEQRRAHLVSVVGIAGIGKSRLAWEFYKYLDGLSETVYWHRGRCLPYGEGVTYWALAEMVKGRAGILEGETPAAALSKLHAAAEQHVADPEERRWVEPRLAHLLGLEDHAARDPEDLFGAWRRFFELISQQHPTVLVFEELQWADTALLDFIEYLLDWSRSYPLFAIVLARPELAERRPGWDAAKRGATSLYLEPLAQNAMGELLGGLVPGLPSRLRDQILDRAGGVPLYAVETVRMLLDRGLLVAEGNTYRPAGPIEALEVPETLHGLIAARLDNLTGVERRLLQDAAVLGKTFASRALAALSGLPEPELEPLLADLVRKELLSMQSDPRSPERGQYGFLQELVRTVAYATLARKDRAARHLAAAAWLEANWGAKPEEIVEVVASHYLEAWQATPNPADGHELKGKARDLLIGAGERAAALAASEEAQRYFEQAAELADQPLQRAELLERAGEMAWMRARREAAAAHLGEAIALFESHGRARRAARVSARLAEVDWVAGHLERGLERIEAAFQVLVAEDHDEDLATLAAELGRLHFFEGQLDLAAARVEVALTIAESLWLPEVLSQALNTKGVVAQFRGRFEEAAALLTHALKLALENDLPSAAVRAYNNLSDGLARRDRYEEALEYDRQGLALARRVGNRIWEWRLMGDSTSALSMTGRWTEALHQLANMPEEGTAAGYGLLPSLAEVQVNRGSLTDARELLSLLARFETSADLQERAEYGAAKAILLQAEARHDDALAAGETAFNAREVLGVGNQAVKSGLVWAAEAALALGNLGKVDELLAVIEQLPPGQRPPLLEAQSTRLRARVAGIRGDREVLEAGFTAAARMLRELGIPFWLAVSLLEHGEWLIADARAESAEPLLAEARQIFERLGARPWVERLAACQMDLQVPLGQETSRDTRH
jgi:class 3 adenylate cyclase/tetratricopeptide (TPR) repeat protein